MAALAERCGMSRRGFARAYRDITGSTPGRAVEALRLAQAQLYLAGDATLAWVAWHSGFGTADNLRRAFVRHYGITADAWREVLERQRRAARLLSDRRPPPPG